MNNEQLKIKNILALFIIICSLLIVNCDLLNKTDPDYWQNIEDKVAWGKAAQLKVNLIYGREWLSSAPEHGRLNMDIREGFEFSLDVYPSFGYSIIEWRAVYAEDFKGKEQDWVIKEDLLALPVLENVILPQAGENRAGGKFSFTINTQEEISLIPVCEAVPSIVRTVPSKANKGQFVQSTPVEIYFYSHLNTETVNFGEDLFYIYEKDNFENDLTDYFYDPVYYPATPDGLPMVKITPKPKEELASDPEFTSDLSLAGRFITVRIGTKIESRQHKEMGGDPYEISWEVVDQDERGGEIAGWTANCSQDGNLISFTFTHTGKEDLNAAAAFTRNGGTVTTVSLTNLTGSADTDSKYSGSFSVGELISDRIKEGRPVSNIEEILITISVEYDDNETKQITDTALIRIWNFPGLDISDKTPAYLIRTAADLAAIRDSSSVYYGLGSANANRQFVLINDISVNEHIPVGTQSNAFTGSFYGNGKTITINGIKDNGENFTDIGLFGYINGGTVRDLTVVMNDVTASPIIDTTAFEASGKAGGIAGTANNETQIENVIVSGSLRLTGGNEIGGVVGFFGTDALPDNSILKNVYSNIELSLNAGTVKQYSYQMGGIVGRNWNTNIESCIFNGIISPNVTAVNFSYIGGLIGWNETDNNSFKINNCNVKGTIEVNINNQINFGGVIGYSYSNNTLEIRNSFFEGDAKIIVSGTTNDIGGFIGQISGPHKIENCGSLSGILNITVSATGYGSYIGGFAPRISGNLSYCFSNVDIIINSTGNLSVGGFSSNVTGGSTIESCYSAGTIRLVHNDNSNINVGGLVSSISQGTTIKNCYSKVNIFADKQSGTGSLIASGLVAVAESTNPSSYININNCYSSGQIYAQNKNGMVNARGITAQISGYYININNSVALGSKIVAAGGGITAVNRITPGGSSSNNHALNSMLVGTGTYDDPNITLRPVTTGTATNVDGANISEAMANSASFWRDTLGFSESVWQIRGGRPLLKLENGTLMDGQQ